MPNDPYAGYVHNAPKPDIACCHPHEITTLHVHCTNYAAYCFHQSTLRVADFADHVLFEEIGRRCRCSKCGKKGAEIRPDWHTSVYFRNKK